MQELEFLAESVSFLRNLLQVLRARALRFDNLERYVCAVQCASLIYAITDRRKDLEIFHHIQNEMLDWIQDKAHLSERDFCDLLEEEYGIDSTYYSY